MTRIVAAAVQWHGITLTLPAPARHHNILHTAYPFTGLIADGQGFITDEGQFVDRERAFQIAEVAGQIIKAHAPPRLYSEDLW